MDTRHFNGWYRVNRCEDLRLTMTQQRATIIINRTPEEARQQRDDFMRLHGGKSAVDVMHEQQARRFELLKKQMGIFDKPAWQLMLDDLHQRVARFTRQQFYYLPDSLVQKSAFKASKALKQSAELLAEIFNTRTALYELARQFSALSLKTSSYQRGISERIVIAMTFKNRSASLQSTVLFTIFRGSFNNEQKRLFTTP